MEKESKFYFVIETKGKNNINDKKLLKRKRIINEQRK